MGKPIEITPELLADVEAKAEFVEPKTYKLNENWDIVCDNPHLSGDTILIARVEFGEDAEYLAAANPAVMLAMIERIRQLETEILSLEIREAVQVLEMLRDKTSDDGEPIDPAGQAALRWAAWIERKEMQLAKMRANLQQKGGAE